MIRRAPASGYLFPEKSEYREQLWCAVAARIAPETPDAHVLIMPSTEGAEIPILLRLGFKEEHIHAVDDNAALIATAQWRKVYPGVRYYGNDLPRALERIRNAGVRLRVANFDLCGCFSSTMVETLRESAKVGALADTSIVSITMLKGREDTATVTALRLLNDALGHRALDCDLRLDAAIREFSKEGCCEPSLLVSGEYRSQTQRMVWACVEVAPSLLREARARIYWRVQAKDAWMPSPNGFNAEAAARNLLRPQAKVQRAYLDLRDLGSGRIALKNPGSLRAVTDPVAAEALAVERFREALDAMVLRRGNGRVFRPVTDGKESAVWWLDYTVGGVRHRESSGSRERHVAVWRVIQRLGGPAALAPARREMGSLRLRGRFWWARRRSGGKEEWVSLRTQDRVEAEAMLASWAVNAA